MALLLGLFRVQSQDRILSPKNRGALVEAQLGFTNGFLEQVFVRSDVLNLAYDCLVEHFLTLHSLGRSLEQILVGLHVPFVDYLLAEGFDCL